jgi:hypothetical protein
MKFNKPGNASVLEERWTGPMGRKTREEFTIDLIVFFNVQNKRARNLGLGCWVTCNNKEDIIDILGEKLLLIALYHV